MGCVHIYEYSVPGPSSDGQSLDMVSMMGLRLEAEP